MKSGLTGRFYGHVVVEMIDGNMWRLIQSDENHFGLWVDGIGRIEPDDGFCFDFASIPVPARWFYPKAGDGPHGQYGPAAVIHDWLYSFPTVNGMKVDRLSADKIFLLGMELKGVRSTMRSLFFSAVRIGGDQYFGKPDKLNKMRGK